MFFSRLAIAALSLGSFASVLAAPISNISGNEVSAPVTGSIGNVEVLDRRTEVSFPDVLEQTIVKLQYVHNQALDLINNPTAAVQPTVEQALAEVAPAMAAVTSAIKSTGADAIVKLGTESVAANVAHILLLAKVIVEDVTTLHTIGHALEIVQDIKTEVLSIQTALEKLVPSVLSLVYPTLEIVFLVITEAVSKISNLAGDAASGTLNGGL